jgi:uncharacterized repeat protein (TIGR01451 family)
MSPAGRDWPFVLETHMAHRQTRIWATAGLVAAVWTYHGHGTTPAREPAKAAAPAARSAAVPGRAVRPGSLDPLAAGAGRQRGPLVETLGRLPLRFEHNAGQFGEGVAFAARGLGYGVVLTDSGATLGLSSTTGQTATVTMSLAGASRRPSVTGRERLPGVVNHYIGSDRGRWRTGVELFERVRYASVYDGIDLEFYGNQQRLEYDFLVAPGADPRAIRLRFDGASRLEIDGAGDLLLHVADGQPLRQHAPVSYQTIDGRRIPVESRYTRLETGDIGFALGDYDPAHPLTIDPVIVYSTFFGGTSQETIYDMALDAAGNIYVTGTTQDQAGFPTTPGAFQPVKPGPVNTTDAFVAKFNPQGSALIYSTFLGGTGDDNTQNSQAHPGRIAVDAAGNAHVAGLTLSTDFPVSANAAEPTIGSTAPGTPDAFFVKLGPTGAFLYGTYIGGTDREYATGIGVDDAGNTYVAGMTRSDSITEAFFTTANGFSGTLRGTYDAFLYKYDVNGARVYATYLGGDGADMANTTSGGLAVDGQGRAYIAGDTQSTNFPIVNGRQTTNGGGQWDAFLAKIDTNLAGAASLVYSTYLGGSSDDLASSVALAPNGVACLVGETRSANFPTQSAPFPIFEGGIVDAFVAKIDTTQSGVASLVYSTYLGGAASDQAFDVAVDPQGGIRVVGTTTSSDFTLVNPIRSTFFLIETFLAEISAAGTFTLSTFYLPAGNFKTATAVAARVSGDSYIAGGTNNTLTNPPNAEFGHPLVNALQSTYGGGDADAFIARIGAAADLRLTKTASPEPVAPNGTLTFTLTLSNIGSEPAAAIAVTDNLPSSVTFVSCSATGGGVCGGSGNNRTITFASLAGGASATVTITATVNVGLGATIVNTASVTSLSGDPNLANNSASSTSHTPSPDPNDTDNDALPNDWETRFGLDPNGGSGDNGAGGDPDGDGRTNLQELGEGSHPRGFVITYLAEGATGTFFDTRLALANPTASTARVLCRFQKDDGTVVPEYRTIGPFSRLTIDVDGVALMGNVAFSSLVEADVQIVADRTMTWDASGYGSHAERGVLTRTATTWYLAEGATHGNFDLFYLIQNPGPTAAEVEIAYLRPAPHLPVVRSYTVAPNSRRTIRVDDVPGLEETDVSAAIRSTNTVPIIVERAMYFSRPEQIYAAGHESAGVTSATTRWFLAEGATGTFFNMFILIANPSAEAASVQMDYLLTDGRTITRTHTVGANNRLTLNVAFEAPELASAAMSTVVTSTNAVPIVVERAMWWPAPGGNWQEAHNSPGEVVTGPRWAVAEGESGGPLGKQTYLLIANTSAFTGTARVLLLFEDGTTAEKTFTLPASSRTNVNVQFEFPAAADRRYGALIEALGGTPAQIVVERAMYANAGGIIWAAGTNALATKLP